MAGVAVVGSPAAVVGSPAALASRRAAIQRKSQREAFAANERERWLRGDVEAVGMPWPDSRISIAGVEPSDSLAASKARVNASLLRWHPDKFESSHAAKFSADALPAVLHRVGLVAERVQLERKLLGATAAAPERAPPPAVVARPVVTRPSQR